MAANDVRVPRLLSVRELARITSVPRWRIYEMVRQRKSPPFLRIGATRRERDQTVGRTSEETECRLRRSLCRRS
jgi:hypothetical protein